jgi:hypothetical protein
VIVTAVMIGHVGKGHHGIARRHLIASAKRPTGKTAQSGTGNGARRQVNATGRLLHSILLRCILIDASSRCLVERRLTMVCRQP